MTNEQLRAIEDRLRFVARDVRTNALAMDVDALLAEVRRLRLRALSDEDVGRIIAKAAEEERERVLAKVASFGDGVEDIAAAIRGAKL